MIFGICIFVKIKNVILSGLKNFAIKPEQFDKCQIFMIWTFSETPVWHPCRLKSQDLVSILISKQAFIPNDTIYKEVMHVDVYVYLREKIVNSTSKRLSEGVIFRGFQKFIENIRPGKGHC